MTVDLLQLPPIVWELSFQGFAFVSIFLMLWETDTAKRLDNIRWNGASPRLFIVRRATMMLKALTLCWTVIYSAAKGWEPWPPIVVFLLAFNVYVVVNTLIMRADIAVEKKKRQPSSFPGNVVTQR